MNAGPVDGGIRRTDLARKFADKDFVLMSGKKRVTQRASRTTLEFIAFTVPLSRGQATLVAASEQIVAGSGS